MRVPDREGPIPEDSCEASLAPPVKSGGDNRNIGGIGIGCLAEGSDQFLAIVEPSIPGKNDPAGACMRLVLKARLPGGVKRSVAYRHAAASMGGDTIRPVRGDQTL